jgi:hypothetical protein
MKHKYKQSSTEISIRLHRLLPCHPSCHPSYSTDLPRVQIYISRPASPPPRPTQVRRPSNPSPYRPSCPSRPRTPPHPGPDRLGRSSSFLRQRHIRSRSSSRRCRRKRFERQRLRGGGQGHRLAEWSCRPGREQFRCIGRESIGSFLGERNRVGDDRDRNSRG